MRRGGGGHASARPARTARTTSSSDGALSLRRASVARSLATRSWTSASVVPGETGATTGGRAGDSGGIGPARTSTVSSRFEGDRFDDAAAIFREVALGTEFPAFLTLPAYARYLVETD